MIFEKKKILVWCDDPQEDPVISVFAGCLANHDRAHRLFSSHLKSKVRNILVKPTVLQIVLMIDGAPITSKSSSPHNPVYWRRVDPSSLSFSRSLYPHSFIVCFLTLVLSLHNKLHIKP
jgi:hypothetical protein